MVTPNITIEREKIEANKVVVFTGLEAGTKYSVTVQTVSGDQRSDKLVEELITCKLPS